MAANILFIFTVCIGPMYGHNAIPHFLDGEILRWHCVHWIHTNCDKMHASSAYRVFAISIQIHLCGKFSGKSNLNAHKWLQYINDRAELMFSMQTHNMIWEHTTQRERKWLRFFLCRYLHWYFIRVCIIST